MARPRKDWDEALTVRLATGEAERVRHMAESRGISYSDLIREAIKAYTEPAPPLTTKVLTQDYSSPAMPSVPQTRIELDESLRRRPRTLTTSLGVT